MVTALSFEQSLDLLKISRQGYTVLDMLAGLGGIATILINSFTIVVKLFNYNDFAS